MPLTIDPVTAAMTTLDRLARVESHGQELEAAISQLVNAMLELKRLQEAAVPVGWQELTRRVRDLEQQLATERACGDLTRVSRMHPKTRSVVFVGTFYFGDNVKYAWLGLRQTARLKASPAGSCPTTRFSKRRWSRWGAGACPSATSGGPPTSCTPCCPRAR